MRVPVKLLGFVFWLFFLTCGQCQDCLQEDINYEYTEPAVKDSYSDGETVRVNCMTGFTGMYKLKCEKGKWKKMIERKCAKKKCSHPGDTPNGDFKLTAGSEFVFGATVLYTCKKGFEMTSRISQRTCRAQGWDKTIPVCEAVKCPAIRTNAFMTASGNTEEGSYGDVIHFECVSPDKKIHGSSDISCTEKGEWSDSVPTCKEITCTAPAILNGYLVDPVQVYQKDAILKYKCLGRFKPREGIPKCAKFGWTLNPECDEVTCELKSRFGVNKIHPEGKSTFRAGESVEITCAEKHWIFPTKETIRSFTCQENGKWDREPVCEVIRCEVPRDNYLYDPHYYFSGDMRLGARKTYYCKSGYQRMVATCERDGWTPKPLCAESTCTAPNIQNARIVRHQTPYYINSWIQYECDPGFEPEQLMQIICSYQYKWTGIKECTAKQKLCSAPSVENGLIHTLSSNRDEIFYSCNTGYKPFSGNWWDSVTCSGDSWSEVPRCIREEECGAFPRVHHGKLKQTPQGTAELECDPGFKPTKNFINCVSGTWETAVCEAVRCGIPPKVENAIITSKPEEFYGDGSSVAYACRSSFLISGESTVSCRGGKWEEVPTCKEATCPLNTADEDLITERFPEIEGPGKPGHKLIFSCNSEGLKLKGRREITCQSNGEWSSSFPKCEAETTDEVMCVANLTANMRSDVTEDGPEVSVKPGHAVTLSCVGRKVKLEGQSKIICMSNGEWNAPFPKCVGGVMCPLNTTDEDLIMKRSPDIEGPVRPKDRVIFSCNREGLKLKGQREITCQSNGEWSHSFPKCEAETTDEVICVANLTANMRSDVTEDGSEVSVKPGHTVTLSCVGKEVKLEGQSEMTCLSNGEWNAPFPKCVEETTFPVNATVKSPVTEDPIKPGHTLISSCNSEGLTLKGQGEITCQSNGEWSGPFPKCEAETTDETTFPVNTTEEGLQQSPVTEDPINPGRTLIFSCNGEGLTLKGQREITCQSNGEWSGPFPKCEPETTDGKKVISRDQPDKK